GLTKDETIKLTVKSLLEVVQTGAKNIEIALMTADSVIKNLEVEEVEAI
ncbi:9168_t:CDS:2, partial [Cetraspora pellucida]